MNKVVIIDDEIWAIEALKAAIDWNSLGFEIYQTFTSPEKALDFLSNNKVDIAIVDIKMPNIDGLTVIDRIRRTNDKIRFIIVSVFTEFENARKAISLGVDDFLVKPVDKEELLKTLLRIKRELEIKNNSRLQDISKITQYLADFPMANGEKFYTEVFGLKRRHKYCFVLMSDYGVSEQISGECELVEYELYSKYTVTVCFTDEKSDYENLEEKLKGKYPSMSVGVSLFHTDITLIKEMINQARLAFFNRFITSYVGVAFYKESDKGWFDSIMKRINSIIEKKSMDKLEELISSVFVPTSSFNIDEVILLGNSILLAVNLLYPANNFEYIPSCESIERRFTGIGDLGNYIHCRINGIISANDASCMYYGKNIQPLIKDYIDSNFQNDINLSVVARRFNLSEKYLGKTFKKYTGTSFTSYLNQRRINLAVKLLSETELPISDISEICGYNDYRYFARIFKRLTGVSATDLRLGNSKK